MALNLLEYEDISRTKMEFKPVDIEKTFNNALSCLKIDMNNVVITYDTPNYCRFRSNNPRI